MGFLIKGVVHSKRCSATGIFASSNLFLDYYLSSVKQLDHMS